MRLHPILAAALTLAAVAPLAGCDNDPAKGKATASVSAPAPQPAAATPASALTYTFSNDGSALAFVGAKVTKKHDGSFGAFHGTVKVADGDPTKGSVTAEVEIASLKADDAKLTGHLKSPDFFDAAKFPKATFTSTSIKAGGDKGATHTVTGNLEMHGVTKSISFPATIRIGEGVDVGAEFAINRKDFGIVYPGMPDDLIKDEVLLKLDVHAKRSGA